MRYQLALPFPSTEVTDAGDMLRRLLALCPTGQEPGVLVVGRAAWGEFALRRALDELGLPHLECPAENCSDPWHVTLLASGASGRSQWTLTLPEDNPDRTAEDA
jgi:hypothetical protein